MTNKNSRKLIIATITSLALFATVALCASQTTVIASRGLETKAATLINGIDLEQTTNPPYFVQAGNQLKYTLNVTNAYGLDLHLTITDTLPTDVTTNAQSAGTILLPGGKLVWTPTITRSETWTQQVVVTVENAYAGPLTNVVEVTSLEGPYTTSTHLNIAALDISRVFLPLITKNRYLKTGELLSNPGFEGIGVPVDNTLPNHDNWTRDTFNGAIYAGIFTPEGWVTWWEEGIYGRPECKVIPNEYPFNSYPNRIYQGYYSGMCFTFFRPQHAGYYQRVENLKPGAVVEGSYYAHAWSCDEDIVVSCGDPEAFSFRVGIDPDGGTDPFSNNILWSAEHYIYDVYDRVGPIQAVVGENGAVTFFLRSYAKWPNKHNDAYWDNPTLVYVEP